MTNIKTWILNKLIQPVVPIIKQAILVLDIVVAKIDSVLKAMDELGVKLDGTILENIKNAMSAISIVRVALVKILKFIGETFGVQNQSQEALANYDLNSEIEKLKSLV